MTLTLQLTDAARAQITRALTHPDNLRHLMADCVAADGIPREAVFAQDDAAPITIVMRALADRQRSLIASRKNIDETAWSKAWCLLVDQISMFQGRVTTIVAAKESLHLASMSMSGTGSLAIVGMRPLYIEFMRFLCADQLVRCDTLQRMGVYPSVSPHELESLFGVRLPPITIGDLLPPSDLEAD
jgi:hypothetical protein